MITIDFHGCSFSDAQLKIHDTVGLGRAYYMRHGSQDPFEVEFITGHGIIRSELIRILEQYGLSPRSKIGNPGCILCLIE